MSTAESQPGGEPGEEVGDRELRALFDDETRRAAAAGRRRRHWLQHQANESATWAGILVEFTDRGTALVVHLVNGHVHRAMVTEVGADFVTLAVGRQRRLVSLASIIAVEAPAGQQPVTGSVDALDAPDSPRLAHRLRVEATAQARLTVITSDARTVTGTLVNVGHDLVLIRSAGAAVLYLPLAAIVEVVLR